MLVPAPSAAQRPITAAARIAARAVREFRIMRPLALLACPLADGSAAKLDPREQAYRSSVPFKTAVVCDANLCHPSIVFQKSWLIYTSYM